MFILAIFLVVRPPHLRSLLIACAPNKKTAKTRCLANVEAMFVHRLRSCPNIDPALGQRLAFAVKSVTH